MTREEHLARLSRCFSRLCRAYPGRPIDRESGEVYADTLADLPIESVERAVEDLLRSSREFMPPPGVIRGEVVKRYSGIPPEEDAWMIAEQTARDFPTHHDAEWSCPSHVHPLIVACVKGLGGWMYLACSPDKLADRAHFFKLYTAARERESYAMQIGDKPMPIALPFQSPAKELRA